MAVLVPCLIALRSEFNSVAPRRDKASDGWIGNRAHALTVSDHNPDESGRTPYEDADGVDEVHGLDVDETGPWPAGFNFTDRVNRVRLQQIADGPHCRLQNIIWRGMIASRSWGWGWRPYGGDNGHFQHAHFSARYTTAQENDLRPWGVAPRPVKEPIMQTMPVAIPLLREGDRDDELAGYNLIGRIQAIVGADRDGIWGPATTAKIAAWVKRPERDCRTLTEQNARDLLGLARPS
jgi:hypothetical protein